jgi:hypothetical protein
MKPKVNTKLIHFRTSISEQAALNMIAKQEAISLSEAMRLSIREAAQRRGYQPVGFLSVGQTPRGVSHESEREKK